MTASERTKQWRVKNLARSRKYHAEYMRRYAKQYPDRVSAAATKYRAKNADRVRGWNMINGKRKTVLRIQKLQKLAGRERPDNCELCGERGHTVFDHNHGTGKFRGWLCHRCNRVLGSVKDDPNLLQKLADYLNRDGIRHLRVA